MENPFKYGGIVRGSHFADRQDEITELVQEMTNLTRVFLISPRRFGKTCLLWNLLEKLQDQGFATAYLDLNAYPDLRTFAGSFTQLTTRALETNTNKLLKIFAGLQRLRPKVSVAPDGSISGTVEVAPNEKDTLSALLEGMQHAEALAQKTRKKLVVVIDEFSDLAKDNGQALEKAMRSEIQKHRHVSYILSGSEESVMLAMTRDRKRAFYKLGRIMDLGPISRKAYGDFIYGWFLKGGYEVERAHLERVLELGRDVPHNVQRLCHVLWELARRSSKVTPSLIEQAPLIVSQQDSPHFELLWHTASSQQKALLIALSKEANPKPFSKEFQFAHGIGPSSSIKASLDSLVKKGILLRTRERAYQFSDIFMQNWISLLVRKELGNE